MKSPELILLYPENDIMCTKQCLKNLTIDFKFNANYKSAYFVGFEGVDIEDQDTDRW